MQGAHPRASPDDGDQVAGLHLLIDKLLQRNADLRRALEGEAQIVHHHGDGAAHLVWTQPHRQRGWSDAVARAGGLWRDRRLRRSRRCRRNVREFGDLLPLAVLQQLEIVGRQVRDRFPLLSVTTASTCTRFTVTLKTGMSGDSCAGAGCKLLVWLNAEANTRSAAPGLNSGLIFIEFRHFGFLIIPTRPERSCCAF